jgi:CRISPR-associated protein Cas1
MISLPDFKEKQILFVNAEWGKPSHLRYLNDNIVFEKERKIVDRVSVHKAFAIFICGDLTFTTGFIKNAKEHGISIFLMKHNFETYGGLATTAEGHYLLREKQYLMPVKTQLTLAKKLVTNKVKNQKNALFERGISEADRAEVWAFYDTTTSRIDEAKTHTELLGVEGNFAKFYFEKKFADFDWKRRAPRTKEDINNFFLDWGYTLLFNFVDSLLRLHGFDTFKGFYHRMFFQRRSLACDMMEPLRPIVDHQITKMHRLGQIQKSDFKIKQGQYCLDFKDYSKYSVVFLQCLMDKKETIFEYIHGFYRHVMNPDKNPFPEFDVKI